MLAAPAPAWHNGPVFRGTPCDSYYYARDDSNIPLYNYVRHLVGCQLGYRY